MAGVLELPDVIPSWAEGGDILQPSDLELAVGWPKSSVPPSRQRFNWALNWLMNASRYNLQTGIPEWSAEESYGLAYVQRDGKTYVALQSSIDKDPLTQPAYWMRWGFSQAEIDSLISVGLGPGKIDLFARSTVPAGWMKANGAIVSRAVYANLFDAIGTVWGAGDGATTFQLPDLRGYFLRVWDDGRGVDVGRAFASAQQDAIQNITGVAGGLISNVNGYGSDADRASGAFQRAASSYGSKQVGGGGGAAYFDVTFDASRMVRTAAETRVKSIALLGCIRY